MVLFLLDLIIIIIMKIHIQACMQSCHHQLTSFYFVITYAYMYNSNSRVFDCRISKVIVSILHKHLEVSSNKSTIFIIQFCTSVICVVVVIHAVISTVCEESPIPSTGKLRSLCYVRHIHILHHPYFYTKFCIQ